MFQICIIILALKTPVCYALNRKYEIYYNVKTTFTANLIDGRIHYTTIWRSKRLAVSLTRRVHNRSNNSCWVSRKGWKKNWIWVWGNKCIDPWELVIHYMKFFNLIWVVKFRIWHKKYSSKLFKQNRETYITYTRTWSALCVDVWLNFCSI